MKKLLLAFLFTLCSFLSRGQVVVTAGSSVQEIRDMLSGLDVTISAIQIHADSSAYGIIGAAFNPVFYNDGLALTSGMLNNLRGPNISGSKGTDLSLPGDPDLDLLAGVPTFDATVIEFDLVSLNDTLFFYFVFGSEEYPEFVDGSVNDGFGVFISGPGINGNYTNNAANFALIPGSEIPVSINELNNGTTDCPLGGPSGPCSHCEYYINNCGGTIFEYDALTTLLEGVVPVTPGETYHVKLAVADGGDGVWDSGVIFPEYAFRTNPLNFTGVDEVHREDGFNVFPNPSGDHITIWSDFNGKQLISVINSLGGLVRTQILTNTSSKVTVSDLDPGIYTLLLKNEDGKVSARKLVISR